MKSKIIIIIAIIAFSFSLKVSAQQAEIRQKMEDMGYTWLTTQYAYLSQGNTAYNYRTLYAYNNYVVVAYATETGVTDMDVYLYDNDGSMLAKDTETDKVAVLEYKPYSTREMKIVMKNYNAYCSTCEYKCEFMLFYK